MMTLAHRRNHSLRFETEFDETQPYFVQSMDEEEFYESTTPSEDIWKKFQLLPTPPRSPGRDEIDDGFIPLITETVTSFHPSITEQLRLVSESLDDGLVTPAPPIFVGDINSNLIQDCMWSGLIDSSFNLNEKDTTSTPTKTVVTIDKTSSSTKCPVTKSTKVPSSNEYGTGDCVDPTAVFPYPLSDRMDLRPDTPSDSEEEIDVVSVSEKQNKVSEITKIRITHNYSAPYSASLKRKSGLNLSLHTTSSSKKLKRESTIEEVKRVLQSIKTPPSSLSSSRSSSKRSSRQSSRNSSRASSDSEDIDKRASHNVLERKRRTDLKNSFMRLRDNIPDLECQERAAKVIILKKAVDYVEELHSTADGLHEEERILRRRNIMLLQRLRTLREDVLGL